MADAKAEGEELKKLVKMGKKKPMSFAFNPGQKNDHTIIIDRRKKPEVIAKIAKKEGPGNKVAFGTFVVNSKTMELTCEKLVPAMAKTLKKYLKSQKIQLNILILDAAGNVVDRDEEDLPDDPSMDDGETAEAEPETQARTAPDPQPETPVEAPPEAAAAAAAETAPGPAELAGRLKAIQPVIAAAAGDSAARLKKAAAVAVAQIKSGDFEAAKKTVAALEDAAAKQQAPADQEPAPDLAALAARAAEAKRAIAALGGAAAGKLTAALTAAAQQLKAGNLEAAETVLGKIEAALGKVTAAAQKGATATSPVAEKWQAAEARLQPLVERLMQERRGDLDAINRVFGFAREQADAGAYDKALAAMAKLAGLVKQAQSAETTAAATDARQAIPDNVAAYTSSRLKWIDTRSGLRNELEGLKSAIDAATSGIEGLEDVPSKSGVLFDHLKNIDSSLEDTLEQLVETPDGEQRETLKRAARDIINSYRVALDTDFFKAVDDNGFAATNIRADALTSLQEVSAALDA